MAAAVVEPFLPEELNAHVVGAEGEVDAAIVADADGARGGACDESSVEGSAVLGGIDRDGRVEWAFFGDGVGEGKLSLDAGAFHREGDAFSAGDFEVFDPDRVVTFFEGDFAGFDSSHRAWLGDIGDEFVIDEQGRAVIGLEVEGVSAVLGDGEITGPDNSEVVLFFDRGEANFSVVLFVGGVGFDLGKIGEFSP